VPNRLENKVFLVVDDDPLQLRLIEKVVGMIGSLCVATTSGSHQALEVFDCVLSILDKPRDFVSQIHFRGPTGVDELKHQSG